eukprot:g4538.t1
MQSNQKYSIPVSFDDFGGGNSMLSALNGLKILSRTMDDCFSRIEKRVLAEKNRLNALSQRVVTAQQQVLSVRGSKTATTVYSTAKYPTSDDLVDYKPIMHDLPFEPGPETLEDPENEGEELEERYVPSENPALLRKDFQELLELYGQVNPDMSFASRELKVGLGKLPSNLTSVDSVLLFNQRETPYKQYNVINTLRGEERENRSDLKKRRNSLMEAPRSMRYGDEGVEARAVEFSFVPKPKAVESLGFVQNLSGYFGQIATDQNFDASRLENSDAYNVPTYHAAALPELPSIDEFSPDNVPAAVKRSSIRGTTTTATTTRQISAPPPPPPVASTTVGGPPPPPQPAQYHNNQSNTTQQQQQQQRVAQPVTKVVAEQQQPVNTTTKTVTGVPEVAKQAPAQRNDLMAAIQAGFKLKKSKKQKKRKAKLRKPRNPMEELRMRLEKRRLGMTNDKSKEKKKRRSPIRAKKEPEKKKQSSNMQGMADIMAAKGRKVSITSFNDSASDDEWNSD